MFLEVPSLLGPIYFKCGDLGMLQKRSFKMFLEKTKGVLKMKGQKIVDGLYSPYFNTAVIE